MLAALLMLACSTRDPALTKPADLVDFKSQLAVKTVWKTDVGSGRADLHSSLQSSRTRSMPPARTARSCASRLTAGKVVWRTDVETTISAGVGSDGFTVAVATRAAI